MLQNINSLHSFLLIMASIIGPLIRFYFSCKKVAFIEELRWWLLRPWYSDENFLRGVNCLLFIPQHGLGFPHPLWRSTLPGGHVHLWQISDNWDWHGPSEQPTIQSSLLFVFWWLSLHFFLWLPNIVERKYLIWYFQGVLSNGCSTLVLIFSGWSLFHADDGDEWRRWWWWSLYHN